MARRGGLFVAIFGPDGSGKSSVVDALCRSEALGGPGVYRLHFRPALGSPSDNGPPVTDPHGRPPRGWWASVAKLLYYLLDYWLGYLFKIRPRLARGEVVVFDRYYHDLLVDPRRYRYAGPGSLSRLVGRLVPTPHLSILLDADSRVLRARKQEVAVEELDRARVAYRRLISGLPGGREVNASRPLPEVVGSVEQILLEHVPPGRPSNPRPVADVGPRSPQGPEPQARERYKRFPPGLRHIRVPTSSREAALAGMAMYAPCRPFPRRLQRIAWRCVRWAGPGALPGRARSWTPPMSADTWGEMRALWRAELGPFDSMAIVGRQQSSRPGYMFLLLRGGSPVAFVKLARRDDPALPRETQALNAVHRHGPTSFLAPEPRAFGELGEWRFLATTTFPATLHRVPEDPPLPAILSEIGTALSELRRPAAIPDHWRPMHGDLTPWNLREFDELGLVLFDWEQAGWGPPGADEVLYRAAAAALRQGGPLPHGDPEAVRFWRGRLLDQATSRGRDDRLLRSLDDALARMTALPSDR